MQTAHNMNVILRNRLHLHVYLCSPNSVAVSADTITVSRDTVIVSLRTVTVSRATGRCSRLCISMQEGCIFLHAHAYIVISTFWVAPVTPTTPTSFWGDTGLGVMGAVGVACFPVKHTIRARTRDTCHIYFLCVPCVLSVPDFV